MADIPRDPRQLARDILAGKVRIEDLARERQMRAGGAARQAPMQQPMQPMQRQVPMRQPMQRQMPLPAQRPMQRVPAQRPMPQRPQWPVQRPVARQPQRLQVTVAPPPPEPVREIVARDPEPAPAPKPARRPARIDELVRSRRALRQGILLAEVLGKPVALRDEW